MRLLSVVGFHLIVFLFCSSLLAQKSDSTVYVYESQIENGDTLAIMQLQPVYITAPRVFASKKEEKQYGRLKRYVQKVYPYAKAASEILANFEDTLQSIESDKEKKAYLNEKEKELQEEFTGELKKLTIMQGVILVKLIDRETGNTSYELVKELRGSFSAFIWQGVARLIGSNLKLEYDPDGEDEMIEEIVLKIEMGVIPYQKREVKTKL